MKSAYIAGVVVIAGLLVLSVLPRPTPQAQGNELKKFSSYKELQQFVKNNIQESSVYDTLGMRNIAVETMAGTADSGPQTPSAFEKSADYSNTNVQVAGVDEPDYVKTDGKYIYTVSGNSVIIAEAYPAENARLVAQINFTNSTVREIFINKDRLVVFGDEYNYQPYPLPLAGGAESKLIARPVYNTQTSFIKIYDVSDHASPVPVRSVSADGYYFNSRMIGDYVYTIINEPVYNYDIVPLPRILPAQAAFPDIYYFDIPDRSYNYVDVIAVNMQTDDDYTSKIFMLPSSENIFVSENNIYLTYVKWFDYRYFFDKLVDEVVIPSIPQLQDRITNVRSLPISNASKYLEIQTIENFY